MDLKDSLTLKPLKKYMNLSPNNSREWHPNFPLIFFVLTMTDLVESHKLVKNKTYCS